MPRKKRRSIQLKDARQAKQSCTGLDENRSQLEEENNADFDRNQDDKIVLHEMTVTPQPPVKIALKLSQKLVNQKVTLKKKGQHLIISPYLMQQRK